MTNGALGSDFSLSLTNSNSEVTVSSGNALTPGGDYLKISSSISAPNLSSSSPSIGYGIILNYKEVGTDPVKAVNAFVYDKLGTQSLNRRTTYSDGVSLSLASIDSDISTLKTSLNTSQILIGAVYDYTDTFDPATAGLSSYPQSTSGDFKLVDLREDARLLFNYDLISDSTILYKDRPSVGDSKFNQNIEFGQDLKISGTLTLEAGSPFTLTPSANEVSISSSLGEHIKILRDDSKAKIRVPYLEADNIKINVEGQYRDVITTGPPSTIPRNLRIFDVYPTEDPNEKKAYIQVKWNWDALVVSGVTSTTITIDKTSYENETIAFSASDLSTYLPGKGVYFSSSDTSYEIASVVDDGSTYTFTVEGDPSGESTTEPSPARVIDRNIEYYKLKFTSGAQQGRRAKEMHLMELSGDFIFDPTYVQKLEGGRSWYCSIQAVNNSSLSSVVTMTSGAYDPNKDGNDSDEVTYGSPFQANLPSIPSAEDGSVDATATTQGFNLVIGGWEGTDNQTRPHDFEILYSTTRTITAGMFNSNPLPGDIERVTTRTGFIQIYSPYPARYSVGVRPRQNGMGVGTAVIQTISSGGGGVVPEDQTLFDGIVNIKTTKFEIVRKITPKVFETRTYSASGDEYEVIDPSALLGKKAVIPVTSPVSQDFTDGEDLTYSNSTHGGNTITPSFVSSGSAPNPDFIKFTSSANTHLITGEGDPDTWAKAVSDPIGLPSQETISIKFSAAMQNWGWGKINVYLIDDSTEEILLKKTFAKSNYYPSIDYHWKAALSYENSTAQSRNVRWEIRSWGNLGGSNIGHNEIAHILVDWYAGTLENTQISGSVGGTTYSQAVEFGDSAEPFSVLKEEAITLSSPSKELSFVRNIVRQYPGASLVKFSEDTTLGGNGEFYVGVSKEGRKIVTKKLDVDYKITTIQYDSSFVEGVSATSPAIIRVFPNDSEGSAASLEIDGTGFKGTNVNLPIKISGSERAFTVDAYDSSSLGNNRSEIMGRLFITGKPIVQDRLS